MSCNHSSQKLQTQAKVFCFYGENKLGFRKLTVTVTRRNTTSKLSKIC